MSEFPVEGFPSFTFGNKNDTVLILTPMKDSRKNLRKYFTLLSQLDYPKSKISVGILVSDSSDLTFEFANLYVSVFEQNKYHNLKIMSYDYNYIIEREKRHELQVQWMRRIHMAKARNRLLQRALQDEEWVLWLDSDLEFFPKSLITDLLETKKTIVAPNCMTFDHTSQQFQCYDRNNWRETESSLKLKDALSKNDILFEGYKEILTGRVHLCDLYDPNLHKRFETVELDGVGGAVLLVNADLHRDGLIFPVVPYENSVETEGLASYAKNMGAKVYGMPNYIVLHEN